MRKRHISVHTGFGATQVAWDIISILSSPHSSLQSLSHWFSLSPL